MKTVNKTLYFKSWDDYAAVWGKRVIALCDGDNYGMAINRSKHEDGVWVADEIPSDAENVRYANFSEIMEYLNHPTIIREREWDMSYELDSKYHWVIASEEFHIDSAVPHVHLTFTGKKKTIMQRIADFRNSPYWKWSIFKYSIRQKIRRIFYGK